MLSDQATVPPDQPEWLMNFVAVHSGALTFSYAIFVWYLEINEVSFMIGVGESRESVTSRFHAWLEELSRSGLSMHTR